MDGRQAKLLHEARLIEFILAKITTNAEKLWKCGGVYSTAPHQNGKLPVISGREIRLLLPEITPSPFCDAKRVWWVHPEDLEKLGLGSGYQVCEHQVDLEECSLGHLDANRSSAG